MDRESIAELYMSFAAVFHRPDLEVSSHLEELIDLWSEVIPDIDDWVKKLNDFCHLLPPGEQRLNALWEHFIPLFETGEVEATPYASVYFGEEGLVLGEEAFKVKQFYSMCGFEIGDSGELPDHLAVELEFCALLARNGQVKLLRDFEKMHLTPFIKRILPKIKKSHRPVYSEVASILEVVHPNLQKVGDYVG